ncbi:MAG: DUF1499 domain-containing protein [Pseudomonadota bacterium]
MQTLATLFVIVFVIVVVAMSYVRFTPVDAGSGQGRPAEKGVGSYPAEGGHYEVVEAANFDMERLETALLKHPRSQKLADGVYVTRTAIWSFPDIIHVWEADGALHISSHLVYGRKDFGMNRIRVESWLEAARR